MSKRRKKRRFLIFRTPPKPSLRGRPGTQEFEDSVTKHGNALFEHHLQGPTIFSRESIRTAIRAFVSRDKFIRSKGFIVEAKPGGRKVVFLGTPEPKKIVDFFSKERRASRREKKRLINQVIREENLIRLEALKFKLENDTRSQANSSRRATAVVKEFEKKLELINLQPRQSGRIVLKRNAEAKKRRKRSRQRTINK